MPGKTKLITVTDAADVPVTAQTETREIHIREDPSVASWPTTDFVVKKPTSADQAAQQPTGAKYTFYAASRQNGNDKGIYTAGQIAGYVRLKTGAASTTFQQDEPGVL